MDIAFMTKYLPMYERAAVLTVKIGLIGIAFAILLGLICAMIQYHKVPVARQIVAVYIEISRNTPLLVQLFFIYYGFPKIGIMMQPETTSGAVAKPNSSAPNNAAITTSRPVFSWPSVCKRTCPRKPFNTKVCCVSESPNSGGQPA